MKKFFDFLLNNINISFIIKNQKNKNFFLQKKNSSKFFLNTFYYPLIFPNFKNNEIFGFCTFSENQIKIHIKNISKKKIKISLNLKNLFYLIQNNENIMLTKFAVFYDNNVEKKNFLYEIFFNDLKIEVFDEYFGFIKFSSKKKFLEKHKIEKINKNYNYYKLKKFFKKYEKLKECENSKKVIFSKFIKILNYFKIEKFEKLKDFLNLEQIKKNKEYYNLIITLTKKLKKNLLFYKKKNLSKNFKISKNEIENILKTKKIKKIVIISSEYNKLIKNGNLGKNLENLIFEFKKKKNKKFIIILPYYNNNKKNKKDYLKKKGVKYLYNINVIINKKNHEIGIHFLKEKNIKFFFLHNFYLFSKIYENYNNLHKIEKISFFNFGALQLLKSFNKKIKLILTIDWFSGFVSAYSKKKIFKNFFSETKFFHFFNNIENNYQGRILIKNENLRNFLEISDLKKEFLVDPFWEEIIINPSRCALINSDNWGTFSKSYKKYILKNNSLKYFLKKFKNPFAFNNGIRGDIYKNKLKFLDNHEIEKMKIMKNDLNFHFKDINKYKEHILFSYIGEISENEEFYLILKLIQKILKTEKRLIFLISTKTNKNNNSFFKLLQKNYPKKIFKIIKKKKIKIYKASDFILNPSKLGITTNHQKSLICGTPIICNNSGNLKDSIIEYTPFSQNGNGFIFKNFNFEEFLNAVKRGIFCYRYRGSYLNLRKNCREGFLDMEICGRAWFGEFYRLFNILPENYNDFKNFNKSGFDIFGKDQESKKDIFENSGNFSESYFLQIEKKDLFENNVVLETQSLNFSEQKSENDLIKNNISLKNQGIDLFKKICENNFKTDTSEKMENFLKNEFSNKIKKKKKEKILIKYSDMYLCNNEVYFLSSFDSWKKKYFLVYNNFNGFWEFLQNIPSGFHEIKFFIEEKFFLNKDMDIFISDDYQVTNYIYN